MKSIYFAILMMPGLVLAQTSVVEFDKLLNSSGLCQGITSRFVESVNQPGLAADAVIELQSDAKQQIANHSRIQRRFIEKYLNFLNSNQPGHGETTKTLEKRTKKLSDQAEESDLPADDISAKTSSCSAAIRGYYPYMFLYDDPGDERIRDAQSPLNRVVTYFGGFVQCAVIMQKNYKYGGGEDIAAVNRARSSLLQWYKVLPRYIKDKLPAADDNTILEFREILQNSMSLQTQILWHKANAETQQQQVQACITLDKNVQELGKNKK